MNEGMEVIEIPEQAVKDMVNSSILVQKRLISTLVKAIRESNNPSFVNCECSRKLMYLTDAVLNIHYQSCSSLSDECYSCLIEPFHEFIKSIPSNDNKDILEVLCYLCKTIMLMQQHHFLLNQDKGWDFNKFLYVKSMLHNIVTLTDTDTRGMTRH